MGYSRYDNDVTRSAYATASTIASTQSISQTFKQRSLHESLDPSKILVRESRDSAFNPNSNAIIIGLDVTGSMGFIAQELAKGLLTELMENIFASQPVVDPQIMIMGIGDANHDSAPLQASQFECDIKIDESLKNLYLEGGGGGNNFESYDLPWYFAANRTSIDCFEKRGKKGYLFTIGDELPPKGSLTTSQINKIFGKTQDIPMSQVEALNLARQKYNVFHIIIEQGSYASREKTQVLNEWNQLLGKEFVLPLSNYKMISDLVVAAMEISEGEDKDNVISSRLDLDVRKVLEHAFNNN